MRQRIEDMLSPASRAVARADGIVRGAEHGTPSLLGIGENA